MSKVRSSTAIHRLMEDGIQKKKFQSATLLIATNEQLKLFAAYGRGALETRYDVASLTKPLATTTVLMKLVEDRVLSLTQRLGTVIPELKQSLLCEISLRQLLSHSSGLPAWKPYYQDVLQFPSKKRKAEVRRRLAQEPFEYKPDTKSVYSDLGFMLLEWAIEASTQRSLAKLASTMMFQPLRLSGTGFIDVTDADAIKRAKQTFPIAPTERCPWRKRRLIAEVHDDNCHAMGGVSGHAGLFSTAYDVYRIASELLAAYWKQPSLFNSNVVKQFFDAHPVKHSTWALGWDRPSAERPSCGFGFSPQSVGHLGFTGTSLWIDLKHRNIVILLTNRVYYGRTPNPMIAFRPRLHEAITKWLQSSAGSPIYHAL